MIRELLVMTGIGAVIIHEPALHSRKPHHRVQSCRRKVATANIAVFFFFLQEPFLILGSRVIAFTYATTYPATTIP